MSILLADSKFSLVAGSISCERWQENFPEGDSAWENSQFDYSLLISLLASFIGGTAVVKKPLAISC